MKRSLFILFALFFLVKTGHAQYWQKVSHNGYSCCSLVMSNSCTMYAAKGVDGNMGLALFIKIKVPYNWGNANTGCVQYIRKNCVTGQTDSQTGFFNYKNGWLYFIEYLSDWCSITDQRGNYPCHTYVITLYENNDQGSHAGRKVAVNTYLDLLNTGQMTLTELSFDIYW